MSLTIRRAVTCYPNKLDIVYTPILTKDYLYRLRRSRHSHIRLNSAACRAACEAGVTLHRPTHQGCRGVSTRPTVAFSGTNCVDYDNITCVSVTPSPSMDHSEPGVDVDVVVSPMSPAINKSASSRVAVPVKLGNINARSICNKTDVFLRIT